MNPTLNTCFSPFVNSLLDEMDKRIHPLYLVGATLRECLRGKPYSGDLDLLVSIPLLECRAILQEAGHEVIQEDNRHNSLLIPLKRNEYPKNIQISSFRYRPGADPSVEEDLLHRDITINAMALRWRDRTLFDPFGGKEDLQHGRIRLVHGEETLAEDPLRAVRFLRFAMQLEGEPNGEHLAMVQACSVAQVTKEKLRAEIDRIFSLPLRSKRSLQLLRKLFDSSLGTEILPEVAFLKQVPLEQGLTAWTLTLSVLVNLSTHHLEERSLILDLRWAALLHELGHATHPEQEFKEASLHDGDGVREESGEEDEEEGDGAAQPYLSESQRMAGLILDRFRFSNRRKRRILRMIHHMDAGLSPSDRLLKRLMDRQVPLEGVFHLIKARAEVLAGQNFKVMAHIQEEFHKTLRRIRNLQQGLRRLTSRDLAISGWEIIDLVRARPGPWLGILQEELVAWISEDLMRNQRDQLTQRVMDALAEKRIPITY